MKESEELVELEGIKITRSNIELIKRTIFPGANDDELALFFYEAKRRGVHPMDRLIYPIARKDKDGNRRVTFQSGIDYLRAAAEETGRYVGQKSVVYGPTITQTTEGGPIEVPEWAEVTVLRKDPETGEINEIPFRAFWREYYPGEKLGHMWRKMPHGQLSKCAEAGSLRKGFPRKLGGLYVNEEMEQAEAVPFGGKHTAIQEPQKKAGNGGAKAAIEQSDAPGSLKLISPILDVEVKTGTKDKKPWTMYVVGITKDGTKQFCRTFSETLGDMAQREVGSGMPMEIEYRMGNYGMEIVSMNLAEIQQELPNG